MPISLRFGTDRSVVFYALLATQLASVMRAKLTPPASDSDEFYRAASIRLMNQAIEESRHLLIVLDGLDEAQGAGYNSTVFPPNLPPTIKILVSAREQAGDRGPEGWLKRLDWQANMAASGGLSILAHKAVIPILESVGIDKNDVCDKLVERLIFLSAGEPLLLGLYATDLSDIARREGKISVRSLEGLSPGFTAYFSRAFDTQSLSENGDALEMTMAVLAMALGPLEGPHLTTLTCNLCNISRPIVSDRFIKPLKRFIAGDGRPGHGYVLNHPKLDEYMLEERFGLDTQQLVENAFLAWGRRVAKTLETPPNMPAPAYVLLHHVDHLCRAGAGSLYDIDLLLTEGWKQAWFNFDNDYTGYADSLLSASAIIQTCTTYHDDAIRTLRLRIKIGLFSGSVRSQGINVPSDLLAMALQDQLITLRQALILSNSSYPTTNLTIY